MCEEARHLSPHRDPTLPRRTSGVPDPTHPPAQESKYDNLIFPPNDPEAFLKFLKELGESYGFTYDTEGQDEGESSGSKEDGE